MGEHRANRTLVTILCLIVMLFSVIVSLNVNGAEQIFYEDDFESYLVGSFPVEGGWELWFNGAGDSFQVIVDNVADSPIKSLQLRGSSPRSYSWSYGSTNFIPINFMPSGGGGWGSSAALPVKTESAKIGFSVSVRVEEIGVGNGDNDNARVAFGKQLDSSHARHYAPVRFCDNGKIALDDQILQSYVADRWYKVTSIIDRSSETCYVWIDDVLVAENLTVKTTKGPVTEYPSSEIEAFTVGQFYNSVTVYFDNVKVFSADDPSFEQTYPIANFDWSPSKPNTGESIHFNASSSQPGWNGTQTVPITSYIWDFGDNTTATGDSVEHIYALRGVYTVRLEVSNVLGQHSVRQKMITVGTSVLSFSVSSSTSLIGFQVNLEGSLTFDGTAVASAPIQILYSINRGNSWSEITLIDTNAVGYYSAVWLPSATGNYIIIAKWGGNDTFPEANAVANLAVIPSREQNIFSVTSNSTISNLAFNSTANELSFSVGGPSNTRGSTNVFISKTLLSDPTNLAVTLDGKRLEYIIVSLDDSWEIQFIYSHSTHTIVVSIPNNTAITSPSAASNSTFIIFIVVTIIITVASVLLITLRRIKHRQQ